MLLQSSTSAPTAAHAHPDPTPPSPPAAAAAASAGGGGAVAGASQPHLQPHSPLPPGSTRSGSLQHPQRNSPSAPATHSSAHRELQGGGSGPPGAASSFGTGPAATLALTGADSRASRLTGGMSGHTRVNSLPQTETLNSSASTRASRDRMSLGLSTLVRPNLRELGHSESLSRAMRRVSSLLRTFNKPSLPKFKPDSQFQWVYGLTGQAGSCMYMAPEVFRGEPYNEKVDVFSFGVMTYELLARELLLVRYIGGTRAGQELGVRDPQQYAKKVCEGFRPPRTPRIPEGLWRLIQACWHIDPVVRPDMSEVRRQLEQALVEWDWQHCASPPARGIMTTNSSALAERGPAAAGPPGSSDPGCRCVIS